MLLWLVRLVQLVLVLYWLLLLLLLLLLLMLLHNRVLLVLLLHHWLLLLLLLLFHSHRSVNILHWEAIGPLRLLLHRRLMHWRRMMCC